MMYKYQISVEAYYAPNDSALGAFLDLEPDEPPEKIVGVHSFADGPLFGGTEPGVAAEIVRASRFAPGKGFVLIDGWGKCVSAWRRLAPRDCFVRGNAVEIGADLAERITKELAIIRVEAIRLIQQEAADRGVAVYVD